VYNQTSLTRVDGAMIFRIEKERKCIQLKKSWPRVDVVAFD